MYVCITSQNEELHVSSVPHWHVDLLRLLAGIVDTQPVTLGLTHTSW